MDNFQQRSLPFSTNCPPAGKQVLPRSLSPTILPPSAIPAFCSSIKQITGTSGSMRLHWFCPVCHSISCQGVSECFPLVAKTCQRNQNQKREKEP